MIDTNTIPSVAMNVIASGAATSWQTQFNAWHLIALGVGAGIVHAYHAVVNAGGVKKIWSNFWNGPQPPSNPPTH